MIEEIEKYINGNDYPDEIPKRIMGLFEREHADLLAEVKRLKPMADELIAIWEILEEDYPQVDRAIVKELIERKIGDYEVIE